ncbi:MAG: glycosyltransferase [Oscillospiraceae bacterium]|nr:glycosyltransferase [Oscillospiraceae bacterium]MBR1898223.1 glycosyltransferase [Oscillospiraceae bacterium]
MKPLFSVIIPAHNEEDYIGRCLDAIRKAAVHVPPQRVQVIVVANRCTDATAEIARSYGAQVLENTDTSIAAIRNAGARLAEGRVIMTIDADSFMSEGTFEEIWEKLTSGDYIGGGAIPTFDRASPGIAASTMVVAVHLLPVMLRERAGLSGGLFWTYKKAFDAIGGFDESLVSMEDMDFAVRLNRLGAENGRKYGTLRSPLITSSRKFDQFGDWYLLKDLKNTRAILTGHDRAAADAFYYNVR